MVGIIELAFLSVGLLVGGFAAWFIAKYKFTGRSGSLPLDEVKENYVLNEVYDALQKQSDLFRDDLLDKEQEIRSLANKLSVKETQVLNLEDRFNTYKTESVDLQKRAQTEFENIANKLLEENGQKFSLQNQQQLTHILFPLKEKIKEFEQGVDKRFLEETRDRISLKKEIEQLRDLNMQLSQDANNLVSALKGESKTQGDWGEFQLEMLLEKSGLTNGIHFDTQKNFKDEDGRDKRPDFIINLPEDKHLVIDSKVSLTAYEKYFNAEKEEKREKHLKNHIESIRQHIKDLNSKNYQRLYQINSPDYLLMFIPIEPAFTVAVEKDPRLFLDALDKNIVIVTTSTLLATMRTVSYIWKQEKQKNSVIEIARQSGMLYDKFVNFVDDLKGVGLRIDNAKNSYDNAMNKLVDSKKFGDTLVGRAEKIRELGAKTNKRLPKEMTALQEDGE